MTGVARIFPLIAASLLCMECLHAQELNCVAEVNASQLPGSDRPVFAALQQAVSDYLNTNAYTDVRFSANEKINCRFLLTVEQYDNDIVSGTLQVQSTRPVYNSSYTTTVLNFKDAKIDFVYQEGDRLVFARDHMESQLAAILDFYAYLIIALDFDSFSPRGGDQYLDRLRVIVQRGQSSGESGWRAYESEANRAAVLNVFTDAASSAIRDLSYGYHRDGLDQMAMSPDKGRAAVHKALGILQQVHSAAPMSVGLSMFKDSKLDEIINIYSQASAGERKEALSMLQAIYPTETARIEKLKD